MTSSAQSEPDTKSRLRRVGIWVIASFWLVQFVELSVVAFLQDAYFVRHLLPERIIVVSCGMVLSLVLLGIAAGLEGRPFRIRLLAILLSALALCAVLVVFAYFVALLPVWGRRALDPVQFVYVGFAWSWFFLSVAAALLALSYSDEERRRAGRLARLEIVAREARLEALRYQVNPHFLFNSLNSVAGLIGSGDAALAEEMIENLADFLRVTLDSDTTGEISLERELEFQRMYLAIEEVRFPHRLRARIEMADGIGAAALPALILQPLVENAVKHGVARSRGLVTIVISAVAIADRLVLRVQDDGCESAEQASARDSSITRGVGLANVEDRLATAYGPAGALSVSRGEAGGFRAEIQIPLRRLT